MLMLHILLVPLIGLPVLGLLRRKLYRDAAVFGAVSMMGYGLWVCIVVNADFILTHHRRFRIDPPGDFLLVRW